jgi:ubiquinone/menaquinone biosynthesis C-methylase UbiE
MTRTLSHREARAFYDRFGSKQDLQGSYEDPAIEVLLRYARFEEATAVVEFGCGTGRLAERLLKEELPPAATYTGFDLSSTMVNLAQARVEPWAGRARIHATEGPPVLPLPDRACDRFLSTYVLDLLSEDDIRALLREARRVTAPRGLLCLASLTFGRTLLSRIVTGAWRTVHRIRPSLVGGCRPLRLEGLLDNEWQVRHREIVCSFGISTEVLVAS